MADKSKIGKGKKPAGRSPGKLAAVLIPAVVALFIVAFLMSGPKGAGNAPGGELTPTTAITATTASEPNPPEPATTTAAAPEPGSLLVRVRDPSGNGIESATVTLFLGAELLETETTDSSGTLRFPDIYPYPYPTPVSIGKEGYVELLTNFSIAPGRETVLEVVLVRTQEPTNLGFVEVRIIDVISREPLAGANATVTDSLGKPVDSLLAVGNGTTLFKLPSGGYYVEISLDGYLKKKTSFIASANQTKQVLVGLGKVYT